MNTEGYACPNPQCRYCGITDAQVHALVGDGKHGHTEQIQTFRCQACHTTFSARRDTPLYRLKTHSQQIAVVLSALAEGLDPSAAERVFGYRQATITTWLTRAGEHAQTLHKPSFSNLLYWLLGIPVPTGCATSFISSVSWHESILHCSHLSISRGISALSAEKNGSIERSNGVI